ncbi:MAG: hypothetical protein ACWGHO_00945 [Candidatus Moraniibacteriota bacterium]
MLKNILKKPIIIYKLLKNILVTLLIIWGLALLGESLLPEFVSAQISFLKLTLLTFIIIFALYIISQKIELPKPTQKNNQKVTLFTSIFFIIIILGLALLKFDYFSNVTIVLTTLLILFYFYKELFEHEN